MSFHYLKCNNYTVLAETSNHLTCSEFSKILENLEVSKLKGRKQLYLFNYFNETFVLRNFHHGGVLQNIFKYKFWEKNVRSFNEFKLTVELFKKNLPVLKPLFAFKSNGNFYTQSISTKLLTNSKDLYLIENIDKLLIEKMFKTIEKFFDFGLIHPDLNIKNILYCTENNKLYLIDFDKAKLQKNPLTEKLRSNIYKRLFRSFDKMGKISVFDNFSFENLPEYIEISYKDYLKISKFRSLLWIFNKK